jgi:hypothetical protein
MIMIWFVGYLMVQLYTEGRSPDAQMLWTNVYFLVLGADAFVRFITGKGAH